MAIAAYHRSPPSPSHITTLLLPSTDLYNYPAMDYTSTLGTTHTDVAVTTVTTVAATSHNSMWHAPAQPSILLPLIIQPD